MRENNYPHQVSDPESEGLPGPADDDSTAWDDVESGRGADGADPAALPSDMPLGVDRYGTTLAEQRRGESLDARLAQEEPDVDAMDEVTSRAPAAGSMADGDDEGDVDGEGGGIGEAATTDPATDSAVSVYDRPEWDVAGAPVGRIVQPDEGSGVDEEKDEIAYDAGAAGGGASAEELAIHEVREP